MKAARDVRPGEWLKPEPITPEIPTEPLHVREVETKDLTYIRFHPNSDDVQTMVFHPDYQVNAG